MDQWLRFLPGGHSTQRVFLHPQRCPVQSAKGPVQDWTRTHALQPPGTWSVQTWSVGGGVAKFAAASRCFVLLFSFFFFIRAAPTWFRLRIDKTDKQLRNPSVPARSLSWWSSLTRRISFGHLANKRVGGLISNWQAIKGPEKVLGCLLMNTRKDMQEQANHITFPVWAGFTALHHYMS